MTTAPPAAGSCPARSGFSLNKPLLLLLALVVSGVPASQAHVDGGIYGAPKPYCENITQDQNVHDYAVAGVSPSAYFVLGFIDGNVDRCHPSAPVTDSDGHSEYAFGGAVLLADDAAFPAGGAMACYGEVAHHPINPTIWVFDHIWPSNVLFMVGADTINSGIPSVPECGDGFDDVSTYCVDHCTVPFGPGLDGAYHVYMVVEAFDGSPFDGRLVDFHTGGGLGDPGHAACLIHPTTSGIWLCVHRDRRLKDPDAHLASAGHVYT